MIIVSFYEDGKRFLTIEARSWQDITKEWPKAEKNLEDFFAAHYG